MRSQRKTIPNGTRRNGNTARIRSASRHSTCKVLEFCCVRALQDDRLTVSARIIVLVPASHVSVARMVSVQIASGAQIHGFLAPPESRNFRRFEAMFLGRERPAKHPLWGRRSDVQVALLRKDRGEWVIDSTSTSVNGPSWKDVGRSQCCRKTVLGCFRAVLSSQFSSLLSLSLYVLCLV